MITTPFIDQSPPPFTDEGPRGDQLRIIAVELAVRDQYGDEHELEMFACQHTINGYQGYGYNGRTFRITVHTSHGDRTVTGTL